MTTDELKTELREIFAEEERPTADWQHVEALCLSLRIRLSKSSLSDTAYPHDLYHYLADADIRQKNVEYASMQRVELRSWLGDEQTPASC